jgi:hypothetical protein
VVHERSTGEITLQQLRSKARHVYSCCKGMHNPFDKLMLPVW